MIYNASVSLFPYWPVNPFDWPMPFYAQILLAERSLDLETNEFAMIRRPPGLLPSPLETSNLFVQGRYFVQYNRNVLTPLGLTYNDIAFIRRPPGLPQLEFELRVCSISDRSKEA